MDECRFVEVKKADYIIVIFGVFIPLITLLVEALMGVCRMVAFNPIPTPLHTLLVLSVPVINLHILKKTIRADYRPGMLDYVLVSAVIATSAVYFFALIPVLPIAIFAILWFGIGLCPFAPLFSLVSAIVLLRRMLKLRAAGGASWNKQSVFSAGGLCVLFCTIAGVLWSFFGESGHWMFHP